jgi:hypothetical protein
MLRSATPDDSDSRASDCDDTFHHGPTQTGIFDDHLAQFPPIGCVDDFYTESAYYRQIRVEIIVEVSDDLNYSQLFVVDPDNQEKSRFPFIPIQGSASPGKLLLLAVPIFVVHSGTSTITFAFHHEIGWNHGARLLEEIWEHPALTVDTESDFMK